MTFVKKVSDDVILEVCDYNPQTAISIIEQVKSISGVCISFDRLRIMSEQGKLGKTFIFSKRRMDGRIPCRPILSFYKIREENKNENVN